MRLILYVAMAWLAISIPVGLFLGRLCAVRDQGESPSQAADVDAPGTEAHLAPVYASFTRAASLDAAQS